LTLAAEIKSSIFSSISYLDGFSQTNSHKDSQDEQQNHQNMLHKVAPVPIIGITIQTLVQQVEMNLCIKHTQTLVPPAEHLGRRVNNHVKLITYFSRL
jgi:hypothetical protein